MDGHTTEGAWPVTLELTADQVEMLIRGIETATMMSGSGKNSTGQSQTRAEAQAYNEFLKDILEHMRTALEEQKPK